MTERAPHPSHRPLRLDYLITDLNVGGVPLHVYRLARRLPAGKIRLRVISLADEGPVGTKLRQAGIPVFACGAGRPWDVAALWRLWRLLRSDPPDVLHAFLFHANVAARLVGPLAGVPPQRIVCEIQTVERERRWHLLVDNLTCRLCRCEVGNSPSVVEHLQRQAHVPASHLRCEWGAVDVEAFASAKPASRAPLGLPTDEPVVIWTGRLDPVKGFEEMLAAFARVCRNGPGRFVLVGEGPYRREVERLISDNCVSHRVSLLGQRSDVAALLRMADVFLFCSRTEGLPNALLEAMAAGLPIVATDVPGCRDLIVNGQTGLLVPAGSVDKIARALRTMLGNPSYGQELGAQARSWVRANLDITELPKRWLRFYDSISQ